MKDDLLFIASFLLITGLAHWLVPAQAECTWHWTCDEHGYCENVPLCDSGLDIPPPQPFTIQPIPPASIKPIDPIVIPPIGAQACTQLQVQDAYGNWSWETVCY